MQRREVCLCLLGLWCTIDVRANAFHTDRFECSVGGMPFQSVRTPWDKKNLRDECLSGMEPLQRDGASIENMLRVKHVNSGAMGSAPLECVTEDGWNMVMALITDASKTQTVGLQLYCSETQTKSGSVQQSDLVIATPSNALHQLVPKAQEKSVEEQPLVEEPSEPGEKGQVKKDERTFLQKYWMFIVLAMYVVLNASRPSGGNAQAPPNQN